MRLWGGVAILTAAAMAVGTAGSTHQIKPGDSAPSYTITAFDKSKTSSDSLRGQVVVINRWATWCGPCKKELPLLDAYYRAHAAQGLKVFAVTTDDSVEEFRLKPLQKVLAIPLVHRFQGSSGFPILEGVPTNYVIDRRGVVRYAQAAAFDEAALDQIVGPLLAEPAPPAVAPALPAVGTASAKPPSSS